MKNTYFERVRQAEEEIERRALLNLYLDILEHEPGDVGPAGEDERAAWLWFVLVLLVTIGGSAWMLIRMG